MRAGKEFYAHALLHSCRGCAQELARRELSEAGQAVSIEIRENGKLLWTDRA
jgi:hypothetical protein